jgi:chlorite dismutase
MICYSIYKDYNMKKVNLHAESHSQENREKNNYTVNHPLQSFSQWFDECFAEHQLVLAEFAGNFCYKKLFLACETYGEKIFAFKEYLKASEGIVEHEGKVLLFIDDIIEFIRETNEIAYTNVIAYEEVKEELRNITPLDTHPEVLPERTRDWEITYEKWQRFKMRFRFFNSRVKNSVSINHRQKFA